MIKRLLFYSAIQFVLIFNMLISISPEEVKKIGLLIWQNEASGRSDLLTFWNPNEPFPSLGIGHFIWSPAGKHIKCALGMSIGL